MARIKHIALAVENPAKTADFYKEVFGLQELRRTPPDSGADGVWLSDGYIYFAILRTGTGEVANTGEPSTTVGVHHIGFYVDDLDEARAAIERANATECANSSAQNRKYADPDGIMIDMRARGVGRTNQSPHPAFQTDPGIQRLAGSGVNFPRVGRARESTDESEAPEQTGAFAI